MNKLDEELLTLFDSFEENGGRKLLKFLKDAQTKYEIATESFLENPGLKIGEIAKLSVLKNALKLDVFKSVEKDVAKRFTSEKARSIQTGFIYHYAFSILIGLSFLITYFIFVI